MIKYNVLMNYKDKQIYYLVNAISFYRLLAVPFLVILLLYKHLDIFKWLLVLSFFTDAVDGYLARKYKVTSAFGSILDSISDDLTIAVAIIGIVLFDPQFLVEKLSFVVMLTILFILQAGYALFRYRKFSGFHTYLAKLATVFQGVFLVLFYWLPQPVDVLFYITAVLTIAGLAEEIILVGIIPKWEADVKGLYWVIQKQNLQKS